MIDRLIPAARQILDRQTGQVTDAISYAQPRYRLTVDGRDITADITARLISLTLTDNRGMDADQLDIRLSDHDGRLAMPPTGAVIRLWLGWSTTGLVDKGTYTVDEINHTGTPDVLTIRARSADLRQGFARKQERSWHNKTLGDILRTIASEHALKPLVNVALAAVGLPHLDQAGESDANLISRLAEDHDAVASVKNGHLLFQPIGTGNTASGLDLPHITLTRADGDGHSYINADRNNYTGVRAYYYETNSAERKQAIAGEAGENTEPDNAKTLRHTYADRESALTAARAEWQRLQRGTQTLTYTLARGRPELIPELTYTLKGVKSEIDAIIWLGGNITHELSDQGLITRLDLTAQLPENEEITGDGSQSYTGVLAWYRDEKTGLQHKVTEGDQANPKRLTHLYASKRTCEQAVKREWERLQA